MIEVHGIGFPNRGAELMLHAVADRARSHHPSLRIACRPITGDRRSAQVITNLGASLKLDTRIRGVSLHWLWRRLPERLLAGYDLATERHTVALLDASGLAYSEQWGPEPCLLGAKLARRYRQAGKPAVLLPQAFGPFHSDRMRNAARELLRAFNLIYARDQESAEACRKLAPELNIRICPDLTIAFSPQTPSPTTTSTSDVAIIPNARILDKTTTSRERYTAFLAGCAEKLTQNGFTIIWLNHEGREDLEIIQSTRASLASAAQGELIDGLEAPVIKSVLGKCAGVVSSRFHGLVSGLSQGVPCAGTGWNHKYHTLLDGFNCGNLLFSPDAGREGGQICAAALIERIRDPSCSAGISSRAIAMRQQIEDMWTQVFDIIDSNLSPYHSTNRLHT